MIKHSNDNNHNNNTNNNQASALSHGCALPRHILASRARDFGLARRHCRTEVYHVTVCYIISYHITSYHIIL